MNRNKIQNAEMNNRYIFNSKEKYKLSLRVCLSTLARQISVPKKGLLRHISHVCKALCPSRLPLLRSIIKYNFAWQAHVEQTFPAPSRQRVSEKD